MRELSDKISGFLNGEFDYESGSLVFSCSKIEINLKQDEIVEGSFTIEEQSGRDVNGRIYSSNILFDCEIEEIVGREIVVPYRVDATGRVPGDVIKGDLHIISDMGEYSVPYVINVIYEAMESTLGNVKNLFHFTNLAKSSWEEAIKLFYQDGFINILTGNDSRYRSLYKGLTAGGDPNCNLEEFLIGIHKKKAIEYDTDKDTVKLINPEGNLAQTIRINRSGWGFVCVKAEPVGDFIRLERTSLTDDDFLGNTCEYSFYIDEHALHNGNNYGCIRFTHNYGSFDVEIQVAWHPDGRRSNASHHEKRMTYSMTRYYLDFRMKRLSMQKWQTQTKELLDHYRNLDSDNVDCSLFEAHLLITQENFNEAKWILDHAIEDPEQLEDTRYCYYLYLTTLYNKDEYYSRQTAERVMWIFKQNPENWRIAWLLLYLHSDMNKRSANKWNFAIEQIENGCYSPIFYMEAMMLLNNEPALLVHLEEAQLRVLQFGTKMQCLTPELIRQITAIAARMKTYDNRLLKILMGIYEQKPLEETLRVICTFLMKGERCDEESFIWYEKGVEHNLPITKLYEYYMMSMDIGREQEIQKKALMYFSYQCALPGRHTAYLYRYIVKNKDRLGELYDAYMPQIGRFILKQLYAGKISGDLAYLYQEILMKEMATPDNVQEFTKLLFVNRITVSDPHICRVIIMDDRLREEMVYPVVDHHAYVKLFSNEYTLLLEDGKGNRYYGTRDYQTECYFLPRKYSSLISGSAQDSIPYHLYLCGDNRDLLTISAKNVESCRQLIRSEAVDPEFSKMIRMNLLQYYFEQDETEYLEEILQQLEPLEVSVKNRAGVVKYLSVYGLYDKAYEFARVYGPENVEAKTIVRFCSGLLEQEQILESHEMTCMLYSAFERGKYNELVLEYLIRNYNGPSKNLRNIWRAAVSFDMEAYSISEKLIMQILETGAYIAEEGEIYKNFIAGSTKSTLNRAYLSYKSYEYLVHDRIVTEYVFEGIEHSYREEEMVPRVCMLAYLKFHSTRVTHLSEGQSGMCEKFIHTLYVDSNIILPFFSEYRAISSDALRIANSALIEYRGNPNSTVVIHYIINREDEENGDYSREEMKNMFNGIFVKEFILFYGETLQYYVTEEYANREQLTESGTIQKSDALSELSEDRFSMVNDIAMAMNVKDYTTSRELLEEYAKKDFITESLFSLQ